MIMDRRRLIIFLILFIPGFILALTSAILLFLKILSSGVTDIIGMLGLGLIIASSIYIAITSKNDGIIQENKRTI
jgi:FtsH-binding integral membrane protein